MIDYFLKFNTEAEAITAATGTALGQVDPQNNWFWNAHFVNPNIKAWRISQDTIGGIPPHIIHDYLIGWFVTVSTNNPNAQLSNHPNLAIELNRDGPPYLRKNLTGIPATDLAFEPVFAGSHYPIGGIS